MLRQDRNVYMLPEHGTKQGCSSMDTSCELQRVCIYIIINKDRKTLFKFRIVFVFSNIHWNNSVMVSVLTVLSLLQQMRIRRSYSILAYRCSMLLTSTATKYSVKFLCKVEAQEEKSYCEYSNTLSPIWMKHDCEKLTNTAQRDQTEPHFAKWNNWIIQR